MLVRVAEWIIDLEGEPVLFEAPLPQNLTARKRRGGIKSDVVRPAECRSQTKQSGHGKILVVATRKVIFRPTGQTCRYKVGPSFRAIEQKRCEFRGQNLEDPPRRTHIFADDSKAPCGCVYLLFDCDFKSKYCDISRSQFKGGRREMRLRLTVPNFLCARCRGGRHSAR